eukprot:1008188-Prymnesium_polylepis.1
MFERPEQKTLHEFVKAVAGDFPAKRSRGHGKAAPVVRQSVHLGSLGARAEPLSHVRDREHRTVGGLSVALDVEPCCLERTLRAAMLAQCADRRPR